MNLTKSKRPVASVTGIFMVIVLLLGMVGTSYNAKAATAAGFSPRLSAPSYSNDYYYSSMNPYYASGYGMPNCVAYAWGRAYEILGTRPKLCTSSAHKWWYYNKSNGYYEYGSTPKLGAIACWTRGSSGHVAVVEKISGNSVTVSQSHSSGTVFNTHTLTVGNESAYAGTFQGYIYILDDVEDLTYTDVVADQGYQTGNYTVSTGGYNLRIRKTASTTGSQLGKIADGKTVYVSKISGNWGKVTYNNVTGWICLDYCDFQGLAKVDGTWYYFNGNKVDEEFTGLAKNKNGWWYVEDGVITFDYDGFAKNSNGTWYVQNSKVTMKYTGFVTKGDNKYYVKNSKVQSTTGLVKVNGTWYYLKDGKQTTYTGIAKNSKGTWYVENGTVTLKYTGIETIDGTSYVIQNSKVVNSN